jgi:hypothetical protein
MCLLETPSKLAGGQFPQEWDSGKSSGLSVSGQEPNQPRGWWQRSSDIEGICSIASALLSPTLGRQPAR